MNSSILLSILSLILIILYRLSKGDFLFFTRPEIYTVIAINIVCYFLYNKLISNNILLLQLLLSLLTPLFFSISRGY